MKKNKIGSICLGILCCMMGVKSGAQKFNKIDKAPHDIAYLRSSMVTEPLVKVIYGRPSIDTDEMVFGNKVAFDQPWRTGANEATEVKLYKDVYFGDTWVKAGTYVLLSIPSKDSWQIILSKNLDVLGAFQYDPNADVAKITVPVLKAERLEVFSIGFKNSDNESYMVLAWGDTRVKIPLLFNDQLSLAKL